MNLRLNLFVMAAVALTAGCGSTFNTANESSFSCPGMPQGIVCKTPIAVYQSTHEAPAPTESDLPFGPGTQASPAQVVRDLAASRVQARAELRTPTMASASLATGAKPVREPARVMRIWIAPWVDKNDDLNFPGYIFTEVKPRSWSMGRKEFAGEGVSVPYKALTAATTEPRESDQRTSGGASMPGLPAAAEIKLD